MCNILYSPGRGREHVNEDRFANEFTGSSVSDLSSSSASDPFRSGCQSPNGYSSSSSRQRSTSSGSFGSFDGNTAYPKSTISGVFSDMFFEPEQASISQPPKNFAISSSETSNPASASHNLFSAQYLQHQITTTSAVDLFADFSNPPSCTAPTEEKPPALPFSESQQWASFDTAHPVKEPVPGPNKSFSSGFPARSIDSTESAAIFLSKVDYSDQFLVQNSTTQGELVSSSDQRSAGINESHKNMDSNCPQVWNALNDLFVSSSEALSMISSHGSEVLMAKPSISVEQCTNVVVLKEAEDGLQVPVQVDDSYMLGLQFSSPFELLPSAALPCEVSTTQACKSSNPFDVPYDLDPGAPKMFLDMSSLQASLPNPQLPSTSVDGFSDPWFHKSSTQAFMPAPQGFSYAGGQITSSPFPNPPSHGSVASFGGNPFA
ncbi:hypothetical protein HPP92_002536 [Vanilla planifolia]|uniref:Uncharacterized protein n=1 Tax=Vanilla planifolia TaxID=51239 RepID=A0A835VJ17_VANPL|nr:hypothetical protein HPP92_002536 [Vanilla planifolia]